jgi:hypothetical protein
LSYGGVQVFQGLAGQGEDFRLSSPVRRSFVGRVFFQHGVEIAAPEAEGGDGGAPGMFRARQPRTYGGVEVEGASRGAQRLYRLADFESRRQHLVIEC